MSNDSCYGSDLNEDEERLSALLEPCSSDDDVNVEVRPPRPASPQAAAAVRLFPRLPPSPQRTADAFFKQRSKSSFDLGADFADESVAHDVTRRSESRKPRRAFGAARSRSFVSRNDSFRFAVHGATLGRSVPQQPSRCDDEIDTLTCCSTDGSERTSQHAPAHCNCDACRRQLMSSLPETYFEHDSGLEHSVDRRFDLFARDEAISCSTPLPHLTFLDHSRSTVDSLPHLDVVRSGSFPLPVLPGAINQPPARNYDVSRESRDFMTSSVAEKSCDDEHPPEVPERGVRFRDRTWQVQAEAGRSTYDVVAPAREGSPSMRHDVIAAPRLSLFGSAGADCGVDEGESFHTAQPWLNSRQPPACVASCSKCSDCDVTRCRQSHLLQRSDDSCPSHWDLNAADARDVQAAQQRGHSGRAHRDWPGGEGRPSDVSARTRSCLGCMMLRQYNFGKGTVFGIFAKPANGYLAEPPAPGVAVETHHSRQSSSASARAPLTWQSPRLSHLQRSSPHDSFSSDCTTSDSTWTNDDLSAKFDHLNYQSDYAGKTVAGQRLVRARSERSRLQRKERRTSVREKVQARESD